MKLNKFERMLKIAKIYPEQEVCGLVAYLKTDRDKEEFLIPIQNVHPNPKHNFAMKHDDQNRVLCDERLVVTGMYHSHNHGTGQPSEADLDAWPMWPEARNWDYFIILNGNQAWRWKLLAGGETIGKRVS